MTRHASLHPSIETREEALADLAGHLQGVSNVALAAAARGEIDVLALVKQELASRGCDHQARWVGFPAAQALAAA